MENSDYTPIDCDIHDTYEIAIIYKQRLLLTWLDQEKQKQHAVIHPLDLVTQKDGEFLIAKTNEEQPLKIRLDKIVEKQLI